jgi:KaiC/GvpD/RAD55 family RecA-like ATPase
MSEIKDYTVDLQRLFLEFLVSDRELLGRTNNIISTNYFDRSLEPAVKFLVDYSNQYSAVPTVEQIKAAVGIELRDLGKVADEHGKWFIDEFEKFCKYKALEKAILKSADLLEKQDYGSVEKLIKEATEVGLAKTFGIDYYADPAGRLNELRNRNAATSTGWKTIDDKLYGGFDRGTLNIFAAPSGGGKSVFLQNIAVNWSQAGMNVVYFSLELSEGLCSKRIDSMVTGFGAKEIYQNLDEVDLKVRMVGKKAGKLQIVQVPNGVTINDIKAWVKEYHIQYGVKFDAVIIDYLDLMHPVSVKVSAENLFIKDKYVSEELRNFAIEQNCFLVTASQLNRGAVESVEFDHSHIAGGLSKIQTADNVIGIFSSMTMRERGRVQIQFMKTRNSSGLGQKVELSWDVKTLKITDLTEEDQATGPTTADVMFNNLKRQAQTAPAPQAVNKPTPLAAYPQPKEGFDFTPIMKKETVPSNSAISSTIARTEQLRNMLRK